MKTKVCTKCKIEKKYTKYRNDIYTKDGLKSSCRECNNQHQSLRKKTDSLYKLKTDICRTIRNSLLYNKSGIIRENSKLRQILGCTLQEFKTHLESNFEPWMNWDNRGLFNGQLNYGWDIDHIIPKSSAKTEEELLKLNHYSNLRPRCSFLNRVEDNRKKKI